jgi:hypothetical protein
LRGAKFLGEFALVDSGLASEDAEHTGFGRGDVEFSRRGRERVSGERAEPSLNQRRPDGPNAGILAIVSLTLSIAAVLIPAAIAGGEFFASPHGSTQAVSDYLTGHRDSVVATGFLVFAASVPLGIYAATVSARLLRLGIRVPGPNIAFLGGISASVMLAVSGLLTWSLGQPIVGESPEILHLLAYLSCALGGVGFVGGIGLLIAGIAIPALVLHLTPRWIAWVGLVLATLSEISFLTLVVPELAILLPIGRFLGLVWLVVIGFLLPRTRHNTAQPGTVDGSQA